MKPKRAKLKSIKIKVFYFFNFFFQLCSIFTSHTLMIKASYKHVTAIPNFTTLYSRFSFVSSLFDIYIHTFEHTNSLSLSLSLSLSHTHTHTHTLPPLPLSHTPSLPPSLTHTQRMCGKSSTAPCHSPLRIMYRRPVEPVETAYPLRATCSSIRYQSYHTALHIQFSMFLSGVIS